MFRSVFIANLHSGAPTLTQLIYIYIYCRSSQVFHASVSYHTLSLTSAKGSRIKNKYGALIIFEWHIFSCPWFRSSERFVFHIWRTRHTQYDIAACLSLLLLSNRIIQWNSFIPHMLSLYKKNINMFYIDHTQKPTVWSQCTRHHDF